MDKTTQGAPVANPESAMTAKSEFSVVKKECGHICYHQELPPLERSCDADISSSSSDSANSVIIATDYIAESIKLLLLPDIEITNIKLAKEVDFLLKAVRQPCKDLSRKKEIFDDIVEQNFVSIVDRTLKCLICIDFGILSANTSWLQLKKLLTISWILSDFSTTLCEEMCVSSNLPLLMADLLRKLTGSKCRIDEQDIPRYTTKALLGLLHNIHRHVSEAREVFRNLDIMGCLQFLAGCATPMIQAKSLLVLSYIINESEITVLNADNKILKFIVQVLQDAYKAKNHISSKFGMSVDETLRGLNNLAINDNNKEKILSLGVLPIYVSLILEYTSTDEVLHAVLSIWRLCFHRDNRKIIRQEAHCIEALMSLQKSSDETIRHAARGALWELREHPDLKLKTGLVDVASIEAECPHVMISYQWDSQPIMLKVKDKLKHAGYKVWMDVEHMTGSTLEAMALAVEKAVVVLICMSQKYKDSPSCRSEAEYTYKLRKSFIPLRLQNNYIPDGWLGMLIGTKLYFDFSTEELLEKQMSNLTKELGDRGKLSAQGDKSNGYTSVVTATPGYVAKVVGTPLVPCCKWEVSDVTNWLEELNLTNVPTQFSDFDGAMLAEMKSVMDSSPEYFYRVLQKELKLSFCDVIKLSKALRQL